MSKGQTSNENEIGQALHMLYEHVENIQVFTDNSAVYIVYEETSFIMHYRQAYQGFNIINTSTGQQLFSEPLNNVLINKVLGYNDTIIFIHIQGIAKSYVVSTSKFKIIDSLKNVKDFKYFRVDSISQAYNMGVSTRTLVGELKKMLEGIGKHDSEAINKLSEHFQSDSGEVHIEYKTILDLNCNIVAINKALSIQLGVTSICSINDYEIYNSNN